MAIKDSIFANGTSHVVPTTLRYHLDVAHGGDKEFKAGTAGGYRRKHDEKPVQITDTTGHEKEFHLDKQGFSYLKHETKEKKFENEDEIRANVYPEATQILKEVTGATHVLPFSHITRFERYEDARADWEGKPDDEIVRKRVPARFVHVDHSYLGAQQILDDNLTDAEERARLSKTRWGIINVWRPIHHDITRDNLTVCDTSTVPESDLEGVTVHLPPPDLSKDDESYGRVSLGKFFELWAVNANPAHKWYYKNQMKIDDVLLIKIFDSKRDGRARYAPHTSFISPEDHGLPRHSIEIRCLVFWEDQSLE